MRIAKPHGFRLSSKSCSTCEDLRRVARNEAALRNARNLYRATVEAIRFRGAAESRRRIEADFSCAEVDLLRDSGSSDQSLLQDARCPPGSVATNVEPYLRRYRNRRIEPKAHK